MTAAWSAPTAVDVVLGDGTTTVCDGTYHVWLRASSGTLTLRSLNGSATTILDGDGDATGLTVDVGVTATIDGLVFENAATGLDSQADALTVTNSQVSSMSGDGMVLSSTDGATASFVDVIVAGNAGDGLSSTDVDVGAEGLTVEGSGGAGFRLSGDLTCLACTVLGNAGSGVFVTYGAVTFVDSRIAGNTAVSGAGLYVLAGDVSLQGTSVDSNSAEADGGGIFVAHGDGVPGPGTLACADSAALPGAIISNFAGGFGGGISFAGASLSVVGCNLGPSGNDDNAASADFDL